MKSGNVMRANEQNALRANRETSCCCSACAGEDGGGERLEEECGGHVGHGGPQEDVRRSKRRKTVNVGCGETQTSKCRVSTNNECMNSDVFLNI